MNYLRTVISLAGLTGLPTSSPARQRKFPQVGGAVIAVIIAVV